MIPFKPEPKFSFDKSKRKYVALKEFTDREQPRETFIRHVEKLTEDLESGNNEFHILVYYGVGGIGKSSLKSKLIELSMNYTHSLRFELDFKDINNRECGNGLRELTQAYKRLNSTTKLSFHHFELAYALYFKKKNPDYLFSKDTEKLLDKFELGVEILSMIDPLGIVGISKLLVDKLYKFIKKLNLDKDVIESLTEFDELTISEIEERLPSYFAYDIKSHLEKYNEDKIIICIDTFEALNEFETHDLKKNINQKWIMELISCLPNVLFVIFGREKISWGEGWNTILDQHLLHELSNDFAEEFLIRCGVEEKSIRERILIASGGHPYYLDLSVDTYFALKNNGGEISQTSFGESRYEILERFVYNLDRIEIEALKVMAIPNYYDRELFSAIIEELKVAFPITQFYSFNQYSFITTTDNKRFYIHKLMREGMLEYIDDELKRNTHMVVFDFYDTKYQINKEQYFFECVYHKINIVSKEVFFEWLNETKIGFIKECQVKGQTVLLSSVFGLISKFYPIEEFRINLFNIYADIVHLAGNYEASVEISERYLSKYSYQDIITNKGLIRLKFRIIHHKMFYVPVDTLINELIEFKEHVDKNLYFEEYCEILYMLGGGLGFLAGNLNEAREWLHKAQAEIENYAEKNKNLNNIMLRTIRKLVDYLRVNNELDDAMTLCMSYLNMEKLNRYQIYLLCSLGEIYRGSGRFNEALECFDKVFVVTKSFGIKGWMAHAHLAKANLYLDIKDFVSAEKFNDSASMIYKDLKHQWGIINSKLTETRIHIAQQKIGIDDNEYLLELKEMCNQYNYRYENELIKKIIETHNIGHQQLLFL